MKKVIYIYKQTNSTANEYKIGKADQRVDQPDTITPIEIAKVRIAEQLTAATSGDFTIVEVFDISHVDNSTIVEHAIHTSLVADGGFTRKTRTLLNKKGTTEWFDFDTLSEGEVLDIVKTLVEKFTGHSGLKTFLARSYQDYIKALVLDSIVGGAKTLGVELAPRFGKTLWTLDTFKTLVDDLGYQYCILPTYWLSSHSSFLEELRSFSNFDNMMFISDKDDNFEQLVASNVDKVLVIATSLHTPEESLSKYKCIADLDNSKKVAFIDEADFGAHTTSSRMRIDLLDIPTKVVMTGTAIERALAGYDVDEIIKWSYMDMLLLQDGNHPMLNLVEAVA